MCESDHAAALPVIIIGAGISGLLVAQQLRKANVPFQIFERDDDIQTRGLGWGLTLHWSLPALRQLLPDNLLTQLPGIFVDRAAVERGESSTFPFFDLTTGEKKSSSPRASADQRIRVTRERLRKLLATGVDIQWSKAFKSYVDNGDSVTVTFEDGTTCQGRLIVGCDGAHSRVRRALAPASSVNYQLPIRMLGFTMRVTTDQARPILGMDPFFLQGTSSADDTFMYISLLEAPGDVPNAGSQDDKTHLFQICISWNTTKVALGKESDFDTTSSNDSRVAFVKKMAASWAEPFRSFVLLLSNEVSLKQIDLDDFVPDRDLPSAERLVLAGDALHAMTMYRGEGANHAIVDVLDLQQSILQQLPNEDSTTDLRIGEYSRGAMTRARPAVLAARKACLDAHDWKGLTLDSPLLTRRAMVLDFVE